MNALPAMPAASLSRRAMCERASRPASARRQGSNPTPRVGVGAEAGAGQTQHGKCAIQCSGPPCSAWHWLPPVASSPKTCMQGTICCTLTQASRLHLCQQGRHLHHTARGAVRCCWRASGARYGTTCRHTCDTTSACPQQLNVGRPGTFSSSYCCPTLSEPHTTNCPNLHLPLHRIHG